MPLVFDDEVSAPPTPSTGRLVFDDEMPVSSPAPGFIGQSMQKLATGTSQAIAGARTSIGGALGMEGMTGRGLSGLAKAEAKAQAEQTPADQSLQREMQANAAEFDAAQGFWNKAGEFTDYAGIVARNPGATFQMGLQSLPNAIVSIPAALAGRAAGGVVGAAAGIESGPGAVATGIGGALAGDVAANAVMEAGPAIYENIIAATNGAARNWTPEQFGAYAKANPDLVNKGLKSGAVRGGIIGTVDALSMGLAGRMLGAGGKAATSTASKLARGTAVTGMEVASEGLGEGLAGYADTGKVDSQAIVQEMAGGIGSGIPTALAGRAMTSFTTQPPVESQSAPTSDPLAAFAATMPDSAVAGGIDPGRPGPMDRATPTSFESGMFDAPAMEGDILRDFNIQPATPSEGRLVFDDESPPLPVSSSPLPQPASVTPEASPVITPEAPASAPVSPEADAGSTPAAGAPFQPGTGNLEPGTQPNAQQSPRPSAPAGNPDGRTEMASAEASTYQGPQFGSAAPTQTRQVPVIPDAPYGGRDVLDFINDNTIAVPRAILDVINQKKKAKLSPQSTGDFNWLEKYDVPKDWRKYFFAASEDSTSNINEVAQTAHDEGLISDPTPDALMGKILETIDAREGYTRDVDAREKQLAAEEKALIAREKAEAKRQQSWADEVINGSMETPFIGIDPKLMAAYTVKGAQLIKEGFTTFAKWSREMISRFGEKVKDYLQGAWQAALKTSERGSIGGDPLDNRATGERMASGSGAAQNANEPSPGGLSEAEKRNGILWHGSKFEFNPAEFTVGENGMIFFADDQDYTRNYGNVVRPFYIGAKNILDLTRWKHDADVTSQQFFDALQNAGISIDGLKPLSGEPLQQLSQRRDADPKQLSRNVQEAGYDGIRIREYWEGGGRAESIAIFDPTLIKSAQKIPAAESSLSEDSEGAKTSFNGAATGNATTPPQTPPSVNPNLNPTGAEGRAQGFKNLDTSGTTAGFLNADIINEGASLIAQGVRDFAAWSKAMLKKFGVAIRDYLQGAWQQITTRQMPKMGGGTVTVRRPEGGFIGTGNREPGTANPNDIKLTHEAERARMEAEGKEPLPTGGQGTVDEWQAEAAARVQQPGAAAAVVSEILAQQRPATPVEHYMLMNYAAALDADLAQANATLADPAAAPDVRAAAAARKTTQDAERDRVAVAQQIAGSKAGAALGARSRGLDRGSVPSLAQMVADITIIQDPTGRTPLPPEERAVIEKTHQKMVEAEQALEKQREEGKGGAQETFNTELQRLLDEAKAEIAEHQAIIETQREILKDKGAPVKLYTKSKAKLQEWSEAGDAAMQRLRDKGFFAQANMGVDVSVIGDLAEVLRGWMSKGVLNTASLTAKLMTTMGERNFMQVKKFLPQIFDKADQLAREGAKKKTPEEILAKGRKAAAANEGKLPRSLARQLALAHIVDHIERKDKTLSAAKIADLVRADLEEFQPGITTREARDLISGYGQATFPSKDEARAELRNLAAQMQKITQLEALRNKERLLKSGPQRDKPSAELRELQKQVEELKKEIGYEARSKEDELKSARDRIKTHLENQIEELQRVLAGKARPTNPREAVVYDAELNALKDLRGSLRDLVAEMPEHKLASEARRNKAALKSAQKSEAEWNRRAKAMQWKRPGKPPAAVSAEVDAARAKAKEARANFEALKKAADPRNDPEAKALRDFKRRTQKSIDGINKKIREGAFDPPKKTPKQIKHDEESNKLKHALDQKKKEWIDLKLEHQWKTMGGAEKGIELVRRTFHLGRSILTGGDLSGLLRQGGKKLFAHPVRLLGTDAPAMMRAFLSPEGETAVLDSIMMRPNAIAGRYKTAGLKIHNPTDYSAAIAEGNARSAWLNKMAGTQRKGLKQLAIPLRFINATGRAYTTLANHMRADWFDMMVDKIETAEKRTLTDRELQSIGEMVNDFTGSGKLGFGKWEVKNSGAKDALSFVLFSPGFLMSNVRTITGASLLGGSKATRKAIATEYLRTAAGGAAWLSLAAMISAALWDRPEDWEEFFDSRSSKFLKVPVGERSAVDLMSGLSQIAVMFRRRWSEQMISNGKLTDLTPGEGRYGQNDMKDIVNQFLRSKMSPEASFWYQRATGADFQGKPTTLLKDARQFMVPITSTQMVDAFRYEKPAEAAALSAATFLGAGVNTYKPRQ